MMRTRSWKLVADIGGTNARFAVVDPVSHQLEEVRHYSVSDYAEMADVVINYLEHVFAVGGRSLFPQAACFAVAAPVQGRDIRFTNSSWRINQQELGVLLKHVPVQIINDFAAVGFAISSLERKDTREIYAGTPVPHTPIVVLGPGTGLGVCTVVPTPYRLHVLPGEGGHVDFAAIDTLDIQILQLLREQFGRVSVERILSGAGIENVYGALSAIHQRKPELRTAAEISAAAVSNGDALAVATLQMFCRTLGSVAGNLALSLGAKGGVYLAGGILPRIADFLLNSEFRARYLAKGRFGDYLAGIPVHLIINNDLGLIGATANLRSEE